MGNGVFEAYMEVKTQISQRTLVVWIGRSMSSYKVWGT